MASFAPFNNSNNAGTPLEDTAPVERKIFANGKIDNYAYFQCDFDDQSGVIKSANKAMKILRKSSNCPELFKKVLHNKLKNTTLPAQNHFENALYKIACAERGNHLNEIVSTTHISDANLKEEKKEAKLRVHFYKKSVDYLRREKNYMDERHVMPKSGYNHLEGSVTITDEENRAMAYQVPQTNIDIPRLRHKISAEESFRKRCAKEIHQHQIALTGTYLREARKQINIIRSINQRLEQLKRQAKQIVKNPQLLTPPPSPKQQFINPLFLGPHALRRPLSPPEQRYEQCVSDDGFEYI